MLEIKQLNKTACVHCTMRYVVQLWCYIASYQVHQIRKNIRDAKKHAQKFKNTLHYLLLLFLNDPSRYKQFTQA